MLPYAEIKLEINNEMEKKLIELSEKDHEGYVLMISPPNPLEEDVDAANLPKIGVMGKIVLKMEINSGITRVVIEGLKRLNVYEYHPYPLVSDILEASVAHTTKFAITPKDEVVLIRKLTKELENYIDSVSYMSNSILSELQQVKSIAKATDLVAIYLPLSFERKLEFLKTVNPYTRVLMLLEDIKKEQEIANIENKIDMEVKNQLDKSQREYILREKMRIIREELGDTNIKEEDIEFLRNEIESANLPHKIRERLHLELKKYEMIPNSSPEITMVRGYMEYLLALPWNIFTMDNKDLNKTRKVLDDSHFGLDKVKTRIVEFLAVKQMNKTSKSPIICLVGPPGVGKTSLARSIAASMNRKFVKTSVGGVNDEAEIIGHRRAYIGAGPGRIISSIKKAGSSNPVFLIDEIDKMTSNVKGDPASSLLEVLDPEQNMYFYDNYIEEEYDLSKVMFILTANYLNDIPEALKDRLEVIELSGYTEYEKLDIAKKHLIKTEFEEHGLDDKRVLIDDAIILDIINYYTKEAGVRELQRLVAMICRKVVTDMLSNKNKQKVYRINQENLAEYLGKKKYFYHDKGKNIENPVGIVNGLAYTQFGGDTLPVEVTYYKGKGNLILTGSLGEVIKESANIALSYIKSHASEFNIDYELIENNDIHIHLPEGAIPKDGPSAGIALTSALISALSNRAVSYKIGMTGEINLRGQILPIGGLKEKVIGAHRSGINEVIIPKDNICDLDEIPSEIKEHIQFYSAGTYQDVYQKLFK